MGQVVARSQLMLSRGNLAECIRCEGLRVSKTLKMESQSKRPTCPSCAKPTQLCLCKRLRSPCLDNQVSVTILQHSLERKHALNSTRIARLGLRNVSVVTVFDVHDEAEFVIRVIGSDSGNFGTNLSDSDDRLEYGGASLELDDSSMLGSADVDNLESEKNAVLVDHGCLKVAESLKLSQHSGENLWVREKISSCEEHRSEDLIRIFMSKKGVIRSVSHSLLQARVEDSSFDHILASPAAMDVLAKGFVVTKFSEGKREFELVVPPGSALLFPSEESAKINDVKERELKLKNLIVLDGTWSKARRMYLENPWLRLLCSHVKLEIEGTSLYREVRRQPREGCLSTIESIVYAMKEIGEDDPEGLDNMLDVFESMVEDQRRCKDDNFGKTL